MRKYVSDPSHIIEPDVIQLKDDLSFEASPARIVDRKTKQLRNKEIQLVKVVWDQKTGDATWELEEKMKN